MGEVANWDKTAGNNTSVGGVSIAEGTLPRNINDSDRAILAAVAEHLQWLEKTAAYTAVRFESILCDTVTTAAFTLTLPASPSNGDWVRVASSSSWASNNLTIGRNSSTIRGASSDLTLTDAGNALYHFVYDGSTWQYYKMYDLDNDLSDIAALTPNDSSMMVGDGTDWVEESGATLRTSIGVGTGDTPQFTGVEVGHASDTTLTRSAAGTLAVEGVDLLSVAGGQLTGTLKFDQGADISSASALTLGSDGNAFDVTGTTAITSINTVGVGTWVLLQFDGALTLTHHATNLILPGGANITTAAGDIALMYEYGSGTWRCASYMTASVAPGNEGGGLFKGENGEVGSSAGDIFRVHEQTLNTDTTIDADENALAAGPLTVASGVTLTVTSGGNLKIV